MTNPLSVLIVGAGPTGLMSACELARRGISFRIIDKKPEPTLASNATWIQTRTIEILNLISMADRFLEIGHVCEAINFYAEGKFLVTLPLTHTESTYPFVLMLAQSGTERLLNERLEEFNKKVERSLELIDVKQHEDMIVATIKHADGKLETINSNWLIGCDGANSTVREKCGLSFPGADLSEQFIVADAQIDTYIPNNEINFFFDKGSVFTIFPLGKNNYRISANLNLGYSRKIYTEKEVIEMAQERAHGEYYVKKVSWISSFWIHSKIVNEMRHGNIFLAGDAAHIHSPAGGQGMNSGLQDAFNLVWKLALVIKGQAKPSLLDSYQSERYPVVNDIVKRTEYCTKTALFDDSFLIKLRKFSNKILRTEKPLSKKITLGITQLDIRYEKSPVIAYQTQVSAKSPQSGERAPDVNLQQSSLYIYLRNTTHNILLFTGPMLTKTKVKKIQALQDWCTQTQNNLIKMHVITNEDLSGIKNIIFDENGVLHKRYHIKNQALYLIRPDNYIAYCSKSLDKAPLEDFWQGFTRSVSVLG